MTVAAALERIVTYPASRVDRPAANIVRDVQNRLHRARAREATAEVKLGVRVSPEELDGVVADEIRSPADELAEVVDDAIESLRFSREEADLILRHRVLDVPTARMAVERGHRESTVRAHRRVAEERLTLITRSTRGLHGAVA